MDLIRNPIDFSAGEKNMQLTWIEQIDRHFYRNVCFEVGNSHENGIKWFGTRERYSFLHVCVCVCVIFYATVFQTDTDKQTYYELQYTSTRCHKSYYYVYCCEKNTKKKMVEQRRIRLFLCVHVCVRAYSTVKWNDIYVPFFRSAFLFFLVFFLFCFLEFIIFPISHNYLLTRCKQMILHPLAILFNIYRNK